MKYVFGLSPWFLAQSFSNPWSFPNDFGELSVVLNKPISTISEFKPVKSSSEDGVYLLAQCGMKGSSQMLQKREELKPEFSASGQGGSGQ